jgi:hypothetical protein
MRMRVSNNAGNIISRWQRRARDFPGIVLVQEREAMEEARKEAMRLSSFKRYNLGRSKGGTGKADKGYPYARNRRPGYPPVPGAAYEINMQSGKLYRGWRTRTQNVGRSINSALYNIMPYSFHLLGTIKMIRRDILGEVNKKLQRIRRKNLKDLNKTVMRRR